MFHSRLNFLLLLFLFGASQSIAQVDTEFWFAAPEITSGHGDRPIYLRISTLDQPATVTVTQPARNNAQLALINVGANATQTIDLTSEISFIETGVPASVMKTGLKIVSSAPITAYYEVGSQWNSDIFVLKGRNGIGNKFVIPAQDVYPNSPSYYPTPYSSFDIVATQNNTVVRVRPTRPIAGHLNQTEIVVKLNAGETYSFAKTSMSPADNPAGTMVESNKPIAISLKDDSVINGGCRDMLGDQLVPVAVAGSEYIVMKGFLNSAEYVFITATEDDTKIFIAGNATPSATLKAGELYRHQITNRSTYIFSNKTIYVFHVTGFGCEMGMAILPSITCKGSPQIGFARTTSEFFGMNIMVRKEGIDYFQINGSPGLISAGSFSAVPGTNDTWYAAQLEFSISQIPVGQGSLISNSRSSFQAGIINGNASTTCRYGYFSSFSTLFIGDDFNICEGQSSTIDAGPGKESYLWSTGATSQQITVSNTGTYWVKIEREDCILTDTVNVNVRRAEDGLNTFTKMTFASIDTIAERNINLSWHIPNVEGGQMDMLFLYKRVHGASWQLLTRVSADKNTFVDPDNETDQHSFEYYMSLVNQCDEVIHSSVHRTMVLSGDADTLNDVVNLQWNPYEGWLKGVERYEVWRKLDNSNGYTLVATVPTDKNSFSSAIGLDGFSHHYVIRALEQQGTSESWSNDIGLEFKHEVFVPNVFTPNADEWNQYFHIKKIELYPRSKLTIFDRWGKPIFDTIGYQNNWDGEGVSSGVYYYTLHLNKGNMLKGPLSIFK